MCNGIPLSCDTCPPVADSDASWEIKHSTSGWVVLWQSAALSWGSRKQKSIALSTCEAEIIAMSEATKASQRGARDSAVPFRVSAVEWSHSSREWF